MESELRPLLLVHLTNGSTLGVWRAAGLFGRECGYLKDLAQSLDLTLGIVSYGEAEEHVDEEVLVLTRPPYMPSKVYSLCWPLVHLRYLRHTKVVRSNQAKGAWVAPVLRTLRLARIWNGIVVFRSGYRWAGGASRSGRRMRHIISVLESASVWTSDLAYTASEDEAREYRAARWGLARKMMTIPNWVADNPPTREPNSGVITVLGVGRVSKEKRPDLFMAAAAANPSLKFVWVGGEPTDPVFRNAPTNLTIVPRVSHERMATYFRGADVFLSVSDYEGMPKALIEAAAAGCYLVGRDTKGVGDLVEALGGTRCGASIEEIGDALRSLADRPAEMSSASARSAQEALRRYGRGSVLGLEAATLTKHMRSCARSKRH